MNNEEKIAKLKKEIDGIRKENRFYDEFRKIDVVLIDPAMIEAMIRNRCRKILRIRGQVFDEMPMTTIGLMRAVGYVISGLEN